VIPAETKRSLYALLSAIESIIMKESFFKFLFLSQKKIWNVLLLRMLSFSKKRELKN